MGNLVLHFQVQLPRKEIVPIIISPQNKKKIKNLLLFKIAPRLVPANISISWMFLVSTIIFL